MHDGLHGSLCSKRHVNDLICHYLLATPLGSLFFVGRAMHLEHHRLVGTEEDPDLGFYSCKNKSDRQSFLSYFFVTLLFLQIKYSLFAKPTHKVVRVKNPKTNLLSKPYALIIMVIVQLIIFFVLWFATGHIYFYLIFWFLPIVTLTVFCDKVRIFCEHTPFQEDTHRVNAVLRTFKSSFIERFFLAPFDMNYHVEHHLYPGIPHQNLHKVYNTLDIDQKKNKIPIRFADSYVKFLWTYFCHLPRKEKHEIKY
jgi:fatty acid desaturase